MKLSLLLRSVLISFILTVVFSIPYVRNKVAIYNTYYFEAMLQSSTEGIAQLFFDKGDGIQKADPIRIPIIKGGTQQILRFHLKSGIWRGRGMVPYNYQRLWLVPIDREASFTLRAVRIVDPAGNVVKSFNTSDISAVQQIDDIKADADKIVLKTTPGANYPIIDIRLDGPLRLPPTIRMTIRLTLEAVIWHVASIMVVSFLLVIALYTIMDRWPVRLTHLIGTVYSRALLHPVIAILVVACLGGVLSCYPVVFFGKSFISPNNNGTALLYNQAPFVPGYTGTARANMEGSDVGAMMWAFWPYSVVESRSIFKDFELPLWNRYNSFGVPLLGQGQSMFGDPLHFIPLACGAAAWAWDFKYVLAKVTFSLAIGLIVFAVTQHLPASAILAFASSFIGFFAYRVNHPAFFSLCYAPWVLYCWLKIIESDTARRMMPWLCGMVLADWTLINSGTVKEAYVLLLAMNLCGGFILLLSDLEIKVKCTKFCHVLASGLAFVMVSAPVWMTFYGTLKSSFTFYDKAIAFQIQPSLFIGFFDDIFYRQLTESGTIFDPCTNFVVLLGLLWSLANLKVIAKNRTYLAIGLSSLISLSFAFGVVPPGWIARVPFIGNIGHIDDVFSTVLIVHVLVLAGFGIKLFVDRIGDEEWRADYGIVLVLLFVLLGTYLGATHAFQKGLFSFLPPGKQIAKAPYFYVYVPILLAAFISLPLILQNTYKKKTISAAGFCIIILCFTIMLWRHGMHLTIQSAFDRHVMHPQSRTDLLAKSEAIETIRQRMKEPFRMAGIEGVLFPGYTGAIGVEGINGPDALVNPYYHDLYKFSIEKAVWGWELLFNWATASELEPLYSMYNVKYFLAMPSAGGPPMSSFNKAAALDLNVYENPKAWPRAFFTRKVASYETTEEFVAMVKEGTGVPFAAVQRSDLDSRPELAALLSPEHGGNVIPAFNYELTNNTTAFEIHAPGKGIAVLTETYMDGDFQVTLNGKKVPYYRVNHAFKGVIIPEAGKYRISFSYWPKHLTLSLAMSGFGIIVLVSWVLYFARRRSSHV